MRQRRGSVLLYIRAICFLHEDDVFNRNDVLSTLFDDNVCATVVVISIRYVHTVMNNYTCCDQHNITVLRQGGVCHIRDA